MQVKKDNIRSKIIEAATDEFYQRGYKDASVRRIAESAGITPGNIYAYFKGKDALFLHIVDTTITRIDVFISEALHEQLTIDGDVSNIARSICDVFLNNRREIIIIMQGSRGTRYENVSEWVSRLIAEKLETECFSSIRDTKDRKMLSMTYSVALISGVFRLFNTYADEQDSLRHAVQLFLTIMLMPQVEKNHQSGK